MAGFGSVQMEERSVTTAMLYPQVLLHPKVLCVKKTALFELDI